MVTGKKLPPYRIHDTAIINFPENVVFQPNSVVHEYAIIRAPKEKVILGEYSHIGPHSVVLGAGGVMIGKYVMISPHCVFAAGSHQYQQVGTPMLNATDYDSGPIVIEDDVWIGANCTITDGVRIGEGAVIGANSVVNKDVEPYDIVAGCPCCQDRKPERKVWFGRSTISR